MNAATNTIQPPSPIFDLAAELAELDAERRRREQRRRERKRSRRHLPLRRGDVCFTRIVFTDAKGMKDRYAVVLGFHGQNVVVAPATSHPPRSEFEFSVSYHGRTGLCGLCRLQCSKLTLVARSVVFRIEGHIVAEDWPRVMEASNAWFHRVVMGDAPVAEVAA